MSRHYDIQRQLLALSQQNQTLRVKTQKINEIESYVNILIQSSQSSQEQLNRSHQQNRSLKNTIDQLMADSLKLQQNYDHQLRFMENQFNRHMLKKDQEIRSISVAREKEIQIYEQKLSQNQLRSKNDIERLKIQFLSLQNDYQDQINKLTSLVNQKTAQLQLSSQSKAQLKKAYLEQSNNISNEISKLQRAYHQSQSQVFLLQEQLGKLAKLFDELTSSQSLLKKQLSTKQDQLSTDRKNFQKKIKFLQSSLNQITTKQKKALQKLNQSTLQNQKLFKQITALSDQANDIKHHSNKLQRTINQKDQQINKLTIKLQQQDEQHKRLLKRHNQQLKRIEQELNLTTERFLCQKRNSDSMKTEIEDLLKVIDKLEASLSEKEHNLQMLNKQNSVLFKQVENITKELHNRVEELQDIDKKYKQSRQNSLTLQQMYKKQSLKSQTLNKQNAQIIARLQSITREQKALQEQELQILIQKHLAQKRQMLQMHRIQKENISNKFQKALKQKDQQAKKRLELLEDEISLMRVKH